MSVIIGRTGRIRIKIKISRLLKCAVTKAQDSSGRVN